eukprot:CAMPEP_0202453228 /NCGR_PEP_ID=MMETSP1360-20130828/11244_1 /ASSEMBLY_ACC=CAM_ASM_000848 /TAXON_ID=515479 /ORGANISM="Licmophora paradoxa, Strain CCMP2313" /LENGTH=180 /DNA_ID=CAMNT_0049072261 /DNA_START=84 /DNA_END=626 /DNA_ORIENTATION=+
MHCFEPPKTTAATTTVALRSEKKKRGKLLKSRLDVMNHLKGSNQEEEINKVLQKFYEVEVGDDNKNNKKDNDGDDNNDDNNQSPALTPNQMRSKSSRAFLTTIWPTLLQLGWRMEHKRRTTDVLYFPPGVFQGKNGARNRTDYFDSRTQVINCITQNAPWKKDRTVKLAVKQYRKIMEKN